MKDDNAETERKKSDAALREEEMLQFWQKNDIFEKSVESPAGKEPKGEFVFYDGPPFATGLPHYGHILASTIKDAVPRYQTMRGKRVRRKWGWDCHGLPLENIIEAQLGLKTKKDIEELGVENFNNAARGAVLTYADDWKRIIPRMGRWVDMESDYKTMDARYTESVWHIFKQLHEKGLVYEGFKSMHLCPRCGTTLSNFEVNQGYKDIKDIAVTVKLPLVDEPDTSLLVWTTTPWTLPGNMAAAVHEDVVYATVEVTTDDGVEKVILAKERLTQLGTDEYKIIEEFKGKELVGKSYVPPFDYFKKFEGKGSLMNQNLQGDFEKAWKIYHAPYVEIGDEGTGAVHLAPAYGDEDMELAKEHDVPIVHHVDATGHFKDFVTDFAGQLVKPKDDEEKGVSHLDADIAVVKKLKEAGKLFRKENITHSYPLCWRCDTPLLNYATTSWFVEVKKIKDKLVAENEKVNWVPEHVGTNRFGKWLEGARDWAVSRQRYWGAPLPIWRNPETKEYKVFGSLEELKEYIPTSGNTYFALRHGEAEHNVQKIASSTLTSEYALTGEGKKQTKQAAEDLRDKNITKLYVSPFARCQETAKIIAEELGLKEESVVTDERLGERGFGVFSDRPINEYFKWKEGIDNWYTEAPEGGESHQEIKQRLGGFLYDIDAKEQEENILFITHAACLRALKAAAVAADEAASRKIAEENTHTGECYRIEFSPVPHNRDYELDYHRPYIDEIELYEEETKLERVPDVFDCWFESGSMPYGQQHYPFEHLDVFDPEKGKGYPANFIAEGLDQTRGWFYSLIVLGTVLFGKSPYENVIVNGLVLAEDGRKMSKKLQNYPDPMDVADAYGVDTLRFYLLSSPLMRGEDLNFSEKELAELSRKNIGRLHNVLAFYELFADGSTAPSTDSAHVLDRWILARLAELTKAATDGYESYELDRATRPVTDFIDDLSVWYIRRSRERVKTEGDDKTAALGTLRYVLLEFSKVIAPVMPFYAEYLFSRVKTEADTPSVHLAHWPEVKEVDVVVLGEMSIVREFVTLALELRAKANIKVRQPLPALRTKVELESGYAALVADEVNVKAIIPDADLSERVTLDTDITPELKAEGDVRELMRAVQDMRKKAGLVPEDKITLTIETEKDSEEIVRTHEDDLRRVTNAAELMFKNNTGAEVVIGERAFRITIEKT